VFGVGLFSVGISGQLDGPSPWHVKGHGSISQLFWDLDVDFETTWGERQNTELPPIPVLPILQSELAKDANWRAMLPAGSNLLVSLRPMGADEAALVLHPLGVLRVSQRAIPLDLHIDKVGGQKPNDVDRLSIAVTAAGLTKKADALEPFAPAQFQNFSDADKLSQPAFAPEHSGIDIAASGADVRTSSMVRRVVRYEEIIIDSNYKRFARRFRSTIGALFGLHLFGAAITKNVNSKAFKARLQPFDDKIAVNPTGFVVATQADNKALSGAAVGFLSAASAHQFMADSVAANPALADTLHVIPQFEMAS
jgi:hypothetical protein